jgi:hypothetical protein
MDGTFDDMIKVFVKPMPKKAQKKNNYMRSLLLIFVVSILFSYCSQPKTIPDQIKISFSRHLKNIDTALVLDSFNIVRIDTMVEKLGRVFDDTVYTRELYRVKAQLASAKLMQKKDSFAIYQEEIDYMVPKVDSVTKSIEAGDTKTKFGLLIRFYYVLRKKDKTNNGYCFYFLDNNAKVLNSDMIDSIIVRKYYSIK